MSESIENILNLVHRPNDVEPWLEFAYPEGAGIQKFIKLANDLNNVSYLNMYLAPFLFRGQADSEWRLEPTLYRLVKNFPKDEALRMEFDSIRHFKQQARVFLRPQLIPEDKRIGDWLALMQQHKTPTRMLDWTTSFNVALYFAVMDEPTDKPGAVWYFTVHELLTAMGEALPVGEYEKIQADREEWVRFGLQRARARIDTYDTSTKFERIAAQQGLFTYCEQLFCDQASLIGNTLWKLCREDGKTLPLCKIVVGPEAKKELRQYLNKLNVTAATLFPGVDGVGRGISEMIVVNREVFHN